MNGRRMAWMLATVAIFAGFAAAGEPDWFTRVKNDGLLKACRVEVERHEKGVLKDSLHVGECYYHLGRYDAGVEVFTRLLRSRDRNYAAAAMVRVGEGYFRLGKKEEARGTFTKCLDQHPDAWLDGSIAQVCHAWIAKLDGTLKSPEAGEKEETPTIREVKREMKELNDRLAELKELIEKLSEEE